MVPTALGREDIVDTTPSTPEGCNTKTLGYAEGHEATPLPTAERLNARQSTAIPCLRARHTSCPAHLQIRPRRGRERKVAFFTGRCATGMSVERLRRSVDSLTAWPMKFQVSPWPIWPIAHAL